MSAAELTETFVGSEIHNSAVKSGGSGLHSGIYSFTKVTQNDWVIFGDFSEVKAVFVTAAGVPVNGVIDGSTKNKVTLSSSSTGAHVAVVWGIKA